MTKIKRANMKEREQAYQIMMSVGCSWCGKQIREDEYSEHPRNCVYFQEYLRQIV